MADWMAFNPADYVSNTLHLTTRQHGGYILLICAAWAGKGTLPGTDAGLMSIAKLGDKEWQQDGGVLKAFLTRRGDAWVHERVEFEWADAKALIAAKSKAGKVASRARWGGRGMRPQCDRNASAVTDVQQNDAPLPLPLPLPTTVTTNFTVTPSAQARASHSQLIDENWLPSEGDVTSLRKEIPWLVGELYDSRQRDFRDWVAANATRSFNPAATWRGFMRRTKQPQAETFDQRRIRECLKVINSNDC